MKTDGFDDEVDVNVANPASLSSRPIKTTLIPQWEASGREQKMNEEQTFN